MADYIAAIDLGTSHLTGIVGEKNANGTFSIIACETVETDNCINRGMIVNCNNTAKHISDMITKLESRLKGDFIDKIYVGVGGQSLRTIDHVETIEIAEGASVTEADIEYMKEKCSKHKPDLVDVLGITPAVYYRDDQKVKKPIGVLCKQFEARYKLVIGRAMIRNTIQNSIESLEEKELAGIIVSPLALADAVLSPNDKELGCALVDFGAGVTSVSVFKDGDLQHLCVIPFGGKLITRDLTTLQLTEDKAEQLKKEKGRANVQKEDENEHIQIEMEGADREIKLSDLNAVIEGRAKEIIENVCARINDTIEIKQLGAGIVIAGGASELGYLEELLTEKSNVQVRHALIQKTFVNDSDDLLGDPMYMMAISLMLKGTKPCVSARDVITVEEGDGVTTAETGKINGGKRPFFGSKNPEDGSDKPPKKPRGGLQKKLKEIFTTNLFDEEEEEQ